MSNEVLDRLLERVTDNYKKDKGSNVRKFWELIAFALSEDEQLYHDMLRANDVDEAKGIALDRIGQKVGQPRGVMTDEVYLVLVKSKIKRSLSNGSIDTIIDILSFLLQVPKSEVIVTELWEQAERNKIPSLNSGDWDKNARLMVAGDYKGIIGQGQTWKSIKWMNWSDMR